jgi:hypothetical protein
MIFEQLFHIFEQYYQITTQMCHSIVVDEQRDQTIQLVDDIVETVVDIEKMVVQVVLEILVD